MDKLKKLLIAACRATIPGFRKIERIEARLEKKDERLVAIEQQLKQITKSSVQAKKHELYQFYQLLHEIGGPPGVRNEHRSPRLTISMTTMPSRLDKVHLTIETLLRQSIQPDRLVLWLDHEGFDGLELPSSLQRQVERGLTIRYCDDLRSYKKLIPSLETFPDDIIVTCDDDAFYPRLWLERLYAAFLDDPKTVHCHRAHRILFEGDALKPYREWEYETDNHETSYLTFPTGVGGILYPPGSLHPDVTDHERFQALAPRADDVWFKAMAVKNGVRAHLVEKNAPTDQGEIRDAIYVIPGSQDFALYKTNWNRDENDSQIRDTFEFHQIMDRLRIER